MKRYRFDRAGIIVLAAGPRARPWATPSDHRLTRTGNVFLSCTSLAAAPLRDALGDLLEGSCRALESSEQPAALGTSDLQLPLVDSLMASEQKLEDRISEAAAGGLTLETWGVVLFVFGLVCATYGSVIS